MACVAVVSTITISASSLFFFISLETSKIPLLKTEGGGAVLGPHEAPENWVL